MNRKIECPECKRKVNDNELMCSFLHRSLMCCPNCKDKPSIPKNKAIISDIIIN